MARAITKIQDLIFLSICLILGVMSFQVFAQTAEDIGFFQKVFELISAWGGLNWAGQVAGVIFLIIGAMKVTFLSKVWDFFGEYKPLVPLVLALIHGIISLAIDPGTQITWAGVMAYVVAGGGSMVLNSILDFVKAIPGIGAIVVSIVDFLQIILKSGSVLESKKLAAKRELNEEMKKSA